MAGKVIGVDGDRAQQQAPGLENVPIRGQGEPPKRRLRIRMIRVDAQGLLCRIAHLCRPLLRSEFDHVLGRRGAEVSQGSPRCGISVICGDRRLQQSDCLSNRRPVALLELLQAARWAVTAAGEKSNRPPRAAASEEPGAGCICSCCRPALRITIASACRRTRPSPFCQFANSLFNIGAIASPQRSYPASVGCR